VGLNYHPIRLESQPSGLRLTADGVSLLAPALYQGVSGAQVDLGAPSPQGLPAGVSGEGRYVFKSWSDGGTATHSITVVSGLTYIVAFEPDPGALFLRGDSNRDRTVDISDAVFTLIVLFTGGQLWVCPDSADANDDGQVDITDPIATLLRLFTGADPLPPGPEPGFDPTADGLSCEQG